jgi:hypothetical protein
MVWFTIAKIKTKRQAKFGELGMVVKEKLTYFINRKAKVFQSRPI